MQTYHFFRVSTHGLVPQTEKFSVTFEDGSMILAPDETPHGLFILEEDGRIIERLIPDDQKRGTDQSIEIPVIFSLEDPRIKIFGSTEKTLCYASVDKHIVDVAYYFFMHGSSITINSLTNTMQELQKTSTPAEA